MHFHSPRPRAALLLASLLAACARERRPYGREIAERAELREAWTTTLVWFAVVFVLVLALVIVRQRRKPIPMLGTLFQPRRLPDVAEWRRRRAAAAAERLARREAERDEERRIRLAARKVAAPEPAPTAAAPEPAPLPLGPPTIGLFRRFGICLLPSLGAAALFFFNIAGASSQGDWLLVALIMFGGGAVLVGLLGSFFCAALMTFMPWHNIGVATVTGALSAALAVQFVPWLSDDHFVSIVAVGAVIGLVLDVAEQASRQPMTMASSDDGAHRACDASPILPTPRL